LENTVTTVLGRYYTPDANFVAFFQDWYDCKVREKFKWLPFHDIIKDVTCEGSYVLFGHGTLLFGKDIVQQSFTRFYNEIQETLLKAFPRCIRFIVERYCATVVKSQEACLKLTNILTGFIKGRGGKLKKKKNVETVEEVENDDFDEGLDDDDLDMEDDWDDELEDEEEEREEDGAAGKTLKFFISRCHSLKSKIKTELADLIETFGSVTGDNVSSLRQHVLSSHPNLCSFLEKCTYNAEEDSGWKNAIVEDFAMVANLVQTLNADGFKHVISPQPNNRSQFILFTPTRTAAFLQDQYEALAPSGRKLLEDRTLKLIDGLDAGDQGKLEKKGLIKDGKVSFRRQLWQGEATLLNDLLFPGIQNHVNSCAGKGYMLKRGKTFQSDGISFHAIVYKAKSRTSYKAESAACMKHKMPIVGYSEYQVESLFAISQDFENLERFLPVGLIPIPYNMLRIHGNLLPAPTVKQVKLKSFNWSDRGFRGKIHESVLLREDPLRIFDFSEEALLDLCGNHIFVSMDPGEVNKASFVFSSVNINQCENGKLVS
jgi:hypothetical protein